MPSPALAALFLVLPGVLAAAAPATPQVTATQIGTLPPQAAHARPDRAYTVDPTGTGDFTSLSDAVAAVPSGGLLLLLPGSHTGATILRKSLRVEGFDPGTVQLLEPLIIKSIGPNQEVSLGGLVFEKGFIVEDCAGEVSLAGCVALNEDLIGLAPPGVPFYSWPSCGVGTSRHRILNSAAVTLVDCVLEGRRGADGGCDGRPGEHGLMVEESRVAIYSGALAGGGGGSGHDCHGTYAGAGGDALWAKGAGTRVFHRLNSEIFDF